MMRMSTGGNSTPGGKNRKVPFVQDILMEAAKSGALNDGKKLEDLESDLVVRKDRSLFVNSMKLVEEL